MADDTFSKDCVGECNDKGEAIGAIINWVHSTLISAVNKGTGAVNSIDFFPTTRFRNTMFSWRGAEVCPIWPHSWPMIVTGCITKCITMCITIYIWAMRGFYGRLLTCKDTPG